MTLITRRRLACVLAVLTLAAITSACFPDVSSTPPADGWDATLFQLINRTRTNAGLPPVANSPKLGNVAGSWSAQMSTDNWMRHQDLGALLGTGDLAGYSTLGETLFVASGGPSPVGVATAWIWSGPHRSIILDPRFNLVGVGHVWGPDGSLWVTADFGSR
ncbi:MAG TPA: CAP domain-containing protein [Acidimicrobiia bacterium]|jgi:uncharacterized protein YkwD